MRKMMTPLAIENLKLERYPKTSDQTLKAWNSADSYLIEHILENISVNVNSRILIINDQFGTLSCSLSETSPTIWTDSFLSKKAINNNIASNHLTVADKYVYELDATPTSPYIFDLVLIRIPKHNSLLEFQLNSIRSYVNNKTKIIAGGMTKEIHNSTLSLFEKYIGKTNTSLAKKKARLIFPTFENVNSTNELSIKTYKEPKYGVTSYGLPGVFSRDKLDIGSRVLLDYLPDTNSNQKVADLGCGTGILGTTLAVINPSLNITFCDESYLAIESAKLTYSKNVEIHQTNADAEYLVTDVLDGIKDNQFDHILCNPPFHQQNVQTLSIANKMFKQSAMKLKGTGELRVVANRHLKYSPMLNQYFKNVKMISNDSKFVVWLATYPARLNKDS